MDRRKKDPGSCGNGGPVMVVPATEGRVVRCLVCGSVEPPRPGSGLATLRDGDQRPFREAG